MSNPLNIISGYSNKRRVPRDTELIICGWTASGSTFLYQVGRELGIKTFKQHGYRDVHRHVLCFYTIRDPRDIILSDARRVFSDLWTQGKEEKAIREALNSFLERDSEKTYDAALRATNVIIIRYENFLPDNPKILIRFTADQFAKSLTEERLKYIKENTSLKENLKRSHTLKDFSFFYKDNQIHGNHISNQGKVGGWKEHLGISDQDYLNQELHSLLEKTNYLANGE